MVVWKLFTVIEVHCFYRPANRFLIGSLKKMSQKEMTITIGLCQSSLSCAFYEKSVFQSDWTFKIVVLT